MNQPDVPLANRIAEWVEVSGRSLELRTARAFRRQGAVTALSANYVDQVTKVTREADVLARYRWPTSYGMDCDLTVVVECKGDRSKPWVAFFNEVDTNAMADDVRSWSAWAHTGQDLVARVVTATWQNRPPFTYGLPAAHIVAAHLGKDRPDQEAAGSNKANDAVRQVLSAAAAMEATWITREGQPGHAGQVMLAAVVTSAPLFTCHLDGSGAVVVAETDQVNVWGWSASGARQRVFVLTEPALDKFADDVRMRAWDARAAFEVKR